jgi:hypothetical protein
VAVGKAQGEKRGTLTATQEPEAQYAGGEGGGNDKIARRTRARKAYMDSMAAHDLHEVWVKGETEWEFSHYRKAHTGETFKELLPWMTG